ncbi:hypothetical protein ACFY8C_32385 [Streptomyces flavochromogenes]|uniref:Uncharacterized protein n=1 Tax=Streptomyces flavochromogenes TaxID=68199 RepID=A0ABW6XZN1_9ACTN
MVTVAPEGHADVLAKLPAAVDGTKIVVASFLDDRTGGTASARAANALRASVEAGPGRFASFQAALFASQRRAGTPCTTRPDSRRRCATRVSRVVG